VLPNEARRPRRDGRARRRPTFAALERLETRALLTYSPTGIATPDLTISGYAAPVAAWGGPFSVTVDIQNLGTATSIQPLSRAPGSTSGADAGAFAVTVYLSTSPRFDVFGPRQPPAINIGTFVLPGLAQNSLVEGTATFTLPPHPAGFPNYSGRLYVTFQVNSTESVPESSFTNNIGHATSPVKLEPPLPELSAVALDVPPVMQPGDTIQPNIEVANLGTMDTGLQGPVTVVLVASRTPRFGPGSRILATYQIENLSSQSLVPMKQPILGDVNITTPLNIETLRGAPVTLPTSPSNYYIGVIVDPNRQIHQIHDLTRRATRPFQLAHRVGPPIPNLPPAGVLTSPSSALTNPFPFPAFPVQSEPAVTVVPASTTSTSSATAPASSASASPTATSSNATGTSASPNLPVVLQSVSPLGQVTTAGLTGSTAPGLGAPTTTLTTLSATAPITPTLTLNPTTTTTLAQVTPNAELANMVVTAAQVAGTRPTTAST
jgi:hypothetical protein